MISKYIKELNEIINSSANTDMRKFFSIIEILNNTTDESLISLLLPIFDDETCHYDLLFELVQVIEGFRGTNYEYIRFLLPHFSLMKGKADDWARTLHYRILNSPSCLSAYSEVITQLTKEQNMVLKEILEQIKQEDSDFSERCDVLILKLQSLISNN